MIVERYRIVIILILKNNIKRFYKIKNYSKNFIRAWHHKKENKYIMILKGALKVSIVKVNNWKKPEKKSKIINFYLSEKNPKLFLYLGAMYMVHKI